MLFKVEAGKNTFDLNPELKAIEEFARLTDRQMTYVILATDYKSPFRKQSLDDKKYHSALTAGYKLEKDGKRLDINARNLVSGKVGAVEAAITVYRKLQKDEDYETLLSLSNLISEIRDFNNKKDKSPTDLKLAVELNVSKLDKLMETKKKLEEILDMREEAQAVIPDNTSDEESVSSDNLSILAQVNEGLL